MANKFVDSADHYATANMYQKYTSISRAAVTAAGRNSNGILLTPGSSISVTLVPQNGWTVGFAWKQLPDSFGANGNIYSGGAVFTEPGFTGGANIVTIITNSDGTLSLQTGNSVTFGTTEHPLVQNTFYSIQLQYTLGGNPISVTAELVINGAVVIEAVSANTGYNPNNLLFGGQSLCNQHTWGSGGAGGYIIDDIWINDNTGVRNTSYSGDLAIYCIYPRQDVTTQWGVSSGATGDGNNYKLVNEHIPDDDISYIEDENPGHVDSFFFDEVTATNPIPFVQLSLYARKTDEGTRAVQALLNNVNVGDEFYLSDDYVYNRVNLDDNDGADWSAAGVNSSSFGIQVTE